MTTDPFPPPPPPPRSGLSALPDTWEGPEGIAPTQGGLEVQWTRPDGGVEPVTLFLRWQDWGRPRETSWQGYVIRAPVEPFWGHLHAPWSPDLLVEHPKHDLGCGWLRALLVPVLEAPPNHDPMNLIRRLHDAAGVWLRNGWPVEVTP